MQVTQSYTVAEGEDSPLTAWIESVDGTPLYKLECHSGEYESRAGEMNFSGLMHCALWAVEGDKPVSANLLADDSPVQGSADWSNRGRFMGSELRGCKGNPAWGADRTFRVRGMKVELTVTDYGDVEDGRTHFAFSVVETPDPRARTAQSEPVGIWNDPCRDAGKSIPRTRLDPDAGGPPMDGGVRAR